ncbi:MAG: glycosyltransferase family 1 protein [Patescibacteria group bacterium]
METPSKKLRIGIDARYYTLPGGIGTYLRELISNLEKLDTSDFEFVIFIEKAAVGVYKPTKPNFRTVVADVPWYTFTEQLKMPAIWGKEHVDLMHYTHFNKSIFFRSKPYVVTIHDLTYSLQKEKKVRISKLMPGIYEFKYMAYKFAIWDTIKRARQIIVPTHMVKKDIMKAYALPDTAVTVTYEGANEGFSPSKKISGEELAKRWGITRPYFVCVSNGSPHKNLKRLTEAFQLFSKENPGYQLVLGGRRNKFYDELLAWIETEPTLKESVIYTGELKDEELKELVASSFSSVFVSLAEGFGIPLLEGMASGVPMITSNTSCLPEIGGDAALYCDPYSPEDIARAMTQLTGDTDLQHKLITQGFTQLKKFSWRTMAENTLAVYKNALEKK